MPSTPAGRLRERQSARASVRGAPLAWGAVSSGFSQILASRPTHCDCAVYVDGGQRFGNLLRFGNALMAGKEKTSWAQVLAAIASVLTSTLTIVLVVQRLLVSPSGMVETPRR